MAQAAAARQPSFSEIPIIDLVPLRSGDAAARKKLAGVIGDACKDIGFLYVINHNIRPDSVTRIFKAAKEFFDLPLERRLEISIAKTEHFRGYMPLNSTGNDPRIRGNLQEAFQIHSELAPDDPDVLAGKKLHGPNLWPTAMPALKAEVLSYHKEMQSLTFDLLRLFALALDLPEDTFVKYFNKPLLQLKLLHYPPQPPESEGHGTRPHIDLGAITVLAQDNTGGLEVLNKNNEWVAAPPVDGSYVVNIGEMMNVWTDGIFSATPHRVVNRSGLERYSVPFVASPDFDAEIAPMMRNPDPDTAPKFEGSVARDKKTTCGEILFHTYSRIWPSSANAKV